jgi:hypothetical protein
MKALLFFASLCWTLFSGNAKAATWTASSCSSSAVQAAINTASAGDTVVIPTGSCTWTTQVSWAVPSKSGSVTTLQGQTSCTGSGDPAFNNLSCTDRTTITGNVSGGNPALLITPHAAGEFRMTGLTWIGPTSSNPAYHGVVDINGVSTNPGVRVDHCHFAGTYIRDLEFGGTEYGVVDHNIFYALNSDENETGIYNGGNWNGSSDGFGHGSWADGPHFGSNQFIILEANYFYSVSSASYQLIADCSMGGRYVARFNTIGYHMVPYTHGTTGSGGTYRGCRALEIYGNTAVWDAGNGGDTNYTFMNIESGTGLVWGNNISGQASLANEDNPRSFSASYTQIPAPNGWGYCGTHVNGTGSAWDQNSNTSRGYACLDQPGRGKGDLLRGNFPTLCDMTTGCSTYDGTWPSQALEPWYLWDNTWTVPSGGYRAAYWANNNGVTVENRDYYLQLPNAYEGATFNGTGGIGQGTLASEPSTCTTGVAWWATDQGNWNTSGNGFGNGVLYECAATNTWTASYTPYTYPHPLTQTAPAPPTNLSTAAN